jgi:DNA-binding MarR family transcriptional regulator
MLVTPSSGSLVREVSRLFVRSQRAQTACVDGASNVQCHVLTELLRVDGITQQALAERLSLDKAWISRAVESLVSDGVVSKLPSDLDKRSVKLSLTPLGRVRAEKLESALNSHAAQVFNLIPQDKHALLEESLNILITALRQNPFDATDFNNDDLRLEAEHKRTPHQVER